MTPPLLQLPYEIWSALTATGLIWEANLSPTDRLDLPEYRVRVSRVLKGRTPRHDLLFRHDGKQYQVVERDGLPAGITNSLGWRMSIETVWDDIDECVSLILDKTGIVSQLE